ncbi:MAG TPA: hypothetical protein VKA27_18845, partial [Sunxiuqinia sp.]|nr:hypothetical protein [Sunxiuqinia sp.]
MKATKAQNIHTAFFLLILLTFGLTSTSAFAEEQSQDSIEGTTAHETFQPGEFIMHHVSDSHEWHIATFGE